jgi:hypothetical protein
MQDHQNRVQDLTQDQAGIETADGVVSVVVQKLKTATSHSYCIIKIIVEINGLNETGLLLSSLWAHFKFTLVYDTSDFIIVSYNNPRNLH